MVKNHINSEDCSLDQRTRELADPGPVNSTAVLKLVTGIGLCWMEDGEIIEIHDEEQ